MRDETARDTDVDGEAAFRPYLQLIYCNLVASYAF